MAGWENFFVAAGGGSAALAGLVFVGISINLSKIMSYASLPLVALEALVLLTMVLVLSLLLLAPYSDLRIPGYELLVIGVLGTVTLTRLVTLRVQRTEVQYRSDYYVLFSGATLAVGILFTVAGIAVLGYGANGMFWMLPGVVLCFCFAMVDAWVLLIEVNR